MIERKRNVSHLNEDQLKDLESSLAGKLSEILSHAALEANQLLNQYGMEVKIGYSLVEQKAPKAKKSKKLKE